MSLSFADAGVTRIKEELEKAMVSLVEVLRHVLSNVHAEILTIDSDSLSDLQRILDSRHSLLEKFAVHYARFSELVDQMSQSETSNLAMVEKLEWLQEHLQAEDVELLVLKDNLACIAKEMKGETHCLLNLLEKKSSSRSMPPLKKAVPHPTRIAVGVVEEEQPTIHP